VVNALEGGGVNTVKTLQFGGGCMTPHLLWWCRPCPTPPNVLFRTQWIKIILFLKYKKPTIFE